MDYHCYGAYDVHHHAVHQTPHRYGIPGCRRFPFCDGCARCQRSLLWLQFYVGYRYRCTLCGSSRTDANGRAAMDCQESVGTAQDLHEGHCPDDVAGGCAQFVPQQHHHRGIVCGRCKDVGQQAERLALQAAHPPELCFRHGWCVYADWYTAQHDHLGSLC